MDQNNFIPPVRQSLTDEEINRQIGSVTADADGMLAAMELVETQTNLREQDNLAFNTWHEQMLSSEDPRAKVALENLERAKSGLEPLPIPDIEQPAVEAPVAIAAEEEVEVFEEVFTKPAAVISEPIATIEPEPEVKNEAVSQEERVSGFQAESSANWVISVGVLAPAAAAVVSAVLGLNFVTTVLAGLVGILVGLKVNILGLITAKRTSRGLAVASRATYGVFGAIVPGVFLILAGIFNLASVNFGAGKFLNGLIVGLPDFASTVLTLGQLDNFNVGSVVTVAIAALAAVLAIFGGMFSRVLKVTIASILVIGFGIFAVGTISQIDYLNLAGFFQLDKFLLVAPAFALIVSVFGYGIDGEALSLASWNAPNKRLVWPMGVFGFLLPLLVLGHFAALLNGHALKSVEEVIGLLLTNSGSVSGTVLVDVGVIAIVGLLYLGIHRLIEALKALGTNHIGYGLAILLASIYLVVISVQSLFQSQAYEFDIELTALLLVPAAIWIGAVLTETVLRRGVFHDASLTRAYGFYGAVNWTAIAIFVLATVFSLGISKPLGQLNWLGFLESSTGFSVPIVVAAWIAMGLSALFTIATAIPRIVRQQKETRAVAERRFDLVDVVVE